MSKPRTTADVARELLASIGKRDNSNANTPPEARADADGQYIAANQPWRFDEIDSLIGDSEDDTPTRRAAAIAVAAHDRRPFVATREGLVRRAHDANGNFTSQAAREAIDLFEYGKANGLNNDPNMKQIARDRALHDFANNVNSSTMENQLPVGGSIAEQGSNEYSSSADAVADAIVTQGRNAK